MRSRNSATAVSRRQMLAGAALAAPVLLAARHLGAPALPGCAVVGIHNDCPWLDPSGRDTPYFSPFHGALQAPDAESLARLGHYA